MSKKKRTVTNGQTRLSFLVQGQKAKVLEILEEDVLLRQRLLDMGITDNVEVKIQKIAPLGDPINIKLRGYNLLVRRKDVENVSVEVIS